MATKKVTGIAEVDTMLASIGNKFGKPDMFDDLDFHFQGSIPTGSAALDAALQVGGLPKGGITEILGEPSGGKTSLALCILANAQIQRAAAGDDETIDVVIDVEQTITEEFMQGFGVNTDKVLHVRPDTAEEALQIARDLPKTGKIGVVIFDSVAAAQSSKAQAKDMGEVEIGGLAKLMHDACRSISKTCAKTNTTMIFINQITYKIGVMHGNPETSPGGNALKYYSICRLKVMRMNPCPSQPDAGQMRVKIEKTKVGNPYGSDPVEFTFYYGRGPDPVSETLEMARTMGFLRHSAGQSKMRRDLLSEEWLPVTTTIEKGKDACFEYFRNNAGALQELRDLVIPQDLQRTNIRCPMTGTVLFEVDSEGTVTHRSSHGRCTKCERYYSSSYLTGCPESRYPTQFRGYLCKGCFRVLTGF
jgi:recombination protein RecA